MAKTIVGIDVGGTFTDIAVLEDGRLQVHKLPPGWSGEVDAYGNLLLERAS